MLTLPWTAVHPTRPGQTCTVFAARLPLHGARALAASITWAWRIRRHLAGTAGVAGHAVALEVPGGALWVVSAWTSRSELIDFEHSNLHQSAKVALRPRLSPATFAVWSCVAADLPPGWPEVRRHIAAGADPANA